MHIITMHTVAPYFPRHVKLQPVGQFGILLKALAGCHLDIFTTFASKWTKCRITFVLHILIYTYVIYKTIWCLYNTTKYFTKMPKTRICDIFVLHLAGIYTTLGGVYTWVFKHYYYSLDCNTYQDRHYCGHLILVKGPLSHFPTENDMLFLCMSDHISDKNICLITYLIKISWKT